MTKELNKEFQEVLGMLDSERLSNEAVSVPLQKGQILTFTGKTTCITSKLIDNEGNPVKYGVFETAEGYPIAFSQIARRNNGLTFKANIVREMLEEFASKIDGKFSVKVKEVRKVESSFGDRKQTFYIFQE